MSKDIIPQSFRQKIKETKEKQLETLDLSNSSNSAQEKPLTKIPEEVFELKQIKILDLSGNRIDELPESIGNLSNLTKLNLSRNQLTNLPESIGNLSSLTELNLEANQLINLPESIGNLSNLTWLYLRKNQLTNLPESIGNLPNLIGLNLWENQLTSLPKSIANFPILTELDLEENYLMNLPKSIENLSILIELDLWGNPLDIPPIEVANKGIKAVKEYFRQLKEEGEDYIYEANLLIVGEAGAGKTTLAKKIQDPQYQLQENQKSTEGIDVIKWSFPLLDKEREFKVNIWDFGGQESYHATHQLLLTQRSLYCLVADTRKEDTEFYYWLNAVKLFSDNSPLLIIKNEKQDRQREINERALRGQFTNLKETLATNLKTDRGLDLILTSIQDHIKKLPQIGQKLPKSWVKIWESLENNPRNYISLQEYLDICEVNGFKRLEDKLQLSGYLHDLGVCLHFQDEEDSLLYKTVILKPEWGIDAIYKVLDNEQVANNQGYFTRNDLKNIWQEEKYSSMGEELLELMKKFQLCYEIPDSKDTFILPQLLSDNQPEYDWNESNNLILRYAYPDFMPKGIISRFIVVMHQCIDEVRRSSRVPEKTPGNGTSEVAGAYIPQSSNQQKYVWKSGVILHQDNTKAEVIEDYGKREIRIRVAGNNKRNFMTIVTHKLDQINNSYNKRLKYQKLIVAGDQNITNIYNSQDLTQAAADIQALLEQLEQSYPTKTTSDQMIIAAKAIEHIESTPTLKQRVISAVKEGGFAAFETAIDNPAGTFVVNATKVWQEVK